MQNAYRAHAQVENGKLTLDNVPFAEGEEVEVIVLAEARKARGERYPLRGSVLRYDDPTAPVADTDWDVLR